MKIVSWRCHRSTTRTATGEPLSIDYRLRAADGHVVWVHEEAVLLRDGDGTPVSWQGFLLDVTERNEAEERLRIAEERYRTIVEHTPVDHLPGGPRSPASTYRRPRSRT